MTLPAGRVTQRRGARQLRSNGAVHGLHGGRAGLVFEDARNQWEVLADGVAVDLGLEVFAGGFHAGDLAKEGDFLFAVGQLGHAAFG